MGGFHTVPINPPPDVGDQLARAVQLRSLIGQQQLQQGQIQMQQMQLQDAKAVRDAFIKNNGDVLSPSFSNDLAQGGASPQTMIALQQHAAQMHNLLLTGQSEQLNLYSKQSDAIAKEANGILQLSREKRRDQLVQGTKNLVDAKIIPPEAAQAQLQAAGQMNDDQLEDYLRVHALQSMSVKDQIEAQLNERKTKAIESEAETRASVARREEQQMYAKMPGGVEENPEQKYIRLQSQARQGQPLSNPDKTWMQGYERNKELVPAFNFNLQQQGVAPSPGAVAGKTGQTFLEGLPAQRQGIVKGIAEGRIPMPSSFALKTPYWQSVMNDVLTYDPDFSTQRADLRKGYTTGKQSDQINAINVVMGHLGNLGDAAGALKNGNVQALNAIANNVGAQLGATPQTTFKAIVQRVGPELDKAYGVSTGGERLATEKSFDPSMSPDQINANISATSRLLRSKIGALEYQWDQNSAPGSPKFQDRFITPAAKRTLDRYSPSGEGGGGTTFAVPKDAPPAPKEDNKVLRDANRNIIARSKGGQWVAP